MTGHATQSAYAMETLLSAFPDLQQTGFARAVKDRLWANASGGTVPEKRQKHSPAARSFFDDARLGGSWPIPDLWALVERHPGADIHPLLYSARNGSVGSRHEKHFDVDKGLYDLFVVEVEVTNRLSMEKVRFYGDIEAELYTYGIYMWLGMSDRFATITWFEEPLVLEMKYNAMRKAAARAST